MLEGKVKTKPIAFGQAPSHVPDVLAERLQVPVVQRRQLHCADGEFVHDPQQVVASLSGALEFMERVGPVNPSEGVVWVQLD